MYDHRRDDVQGHVTADKVLCEVAWLSTVAEPPAFGFATSIHVNHDDGRYDGEFQETVCVGTDRTERALS